LTALSLFVIPTDRPCGPQLKSYQSDIAKLAAKQNVYVMVLEDRALPESVTDQHRAAITDVVSAIDGIDGSVFSNDEWRALTADRAWPSFAHHLISDEQESYGRAFNKCALVAAALGATAIHRRDSDTSLPGLCDDWDIYPSDIESDVLNNKLFDVVGGNYWGNWNVALGPLADEPERLRLILSAHGIPKVGQDNIINEQLPRAKEPPKPDRGGVTRGAYPDLGNCAFRADAALAFPAPLVPDTVGTDYLFLAFAVRLGRAWLHGVNMRHVHSTDRTGYGYLHDYWLRRAKQMDFLLIFHHLDGQGGPAQDYGAERLRLGEAMRDLRDLREDADPVRRVYWGAYAEAFRGSELDEATGIASHIRSIEGATRHENDLALADYGALLRDWSGICDGLVPLLRRFLRD
jgi:hypothetical protein